MRDDEHGVVDRLIGEEIRCVVADAIADGGIISAREHAIRILEAHRGCGLGEAELADRIMMAAASAGVAIEIGDPGRRGPRLRA